MKKVGGRLTLLALVVVLSVIFFIPTYQPFYQALPGWLKQVMPNKGITLGLDLQGGIHLVMEVDEDRAVEIAVDRSCPFKMSWLKRKSPWSLSRGRDRLRSRCSFKMPNSRSRIRS